MFVFWQVSRQIEGEYIEFQAEMKEIVELNIEKEINKQFANYDTVYKPKYGQPFSFQGYIS